VTVSPPPRLKIEDRRIEDRVASASHRFPLTNDDHQQPGRAYLKHLPSLRTGPEMMTVLCSRSIRRQLASLLFVVVCRCICTASARAHSTRIIAASASLPHHDFVSCSRRRHTAAAHQRQWHQRQQQQPWRRGSSLYHYPESWGREATLLASSKRSKRKPKSTSSSPRTVPVDKEELQQRRQLTYADLTPIGRLAAGTVEVAIVTCFEYMSGLFGGYFIGCVTDIPRLLFRSTIDSASQQPMVPPPFWKEAAGRFARMHQKSASWGKK